MAIATDHIQQAADTIAGYIVDTPCLHSRTLSRIMGAHVFLKFERLQFTASFKERGAPNAQRSQASKISKAWRKQPSVSRGVTHGVEGDVRVRAHDRPG
jgi:threonine dehydratase